MHVAFAREHSHSAQHTISLAEETAVGLEPIQLRLTARPRPRPMNHLHLFVVVVIIHQDMNAALAAAN